MLEQLEHQKKLTANQWKIAMAATIGDMLDFFDFGLIGFVLAFIVKDWHLTFGESGLILLAPALPRRSARCSGAGRPIRSAAARR
jgi:putative MFS transporter